MKYIFKHWLKKKSPMLEKLIEKWLLKKVAKSVQKEPLAHLNQEEK